MNEKSIPLPCPFCSSTNIHVDLDIESCVCRECGATGPSMLKKRFETDEACIEAAIKAWNERPVPLSAESQQMLDAGLRSAREEPSVSLGDFSEYAKDLP